jgi:hypothetical protein
MGRAWAIGLHALAPGIDRDRFGSSQRQRQKPLEATRERPLPLGTFAAGRRRYVLHAAAEIDTDRSSRELPGFFAQRL